MTHTGSPRIFTFYSYKGGTGRSMALANVAWVLASNGRRVLAVDWDLEAPGLHRYFHPFLTDPELTSTPGLLDLLEEFVNAAVGPAGEGEGERWFEAHAEVRPYAVALRWEFPGSGRLDLLPAGRQGPAYAARVNGFDWGHFYDQLGGGVFLEAVRERMRRDYDYVLIDSRTGVCDTSGICTVQMPDSLVVCFTANRQSIEGAAAVAASVRQSWTASGGDAPPRRVFPVPMRIELGQLERLQRARDQAREAFAPVLDHLDASARNEYWKRVEMLYYPFYAYEETLAVFGDRPGESNSLLAAAERLTAYLTDGAVTALNPPSEAERQRILAATGSGPAEPPREVPAEGKGCRIFVASTELDLRDHRARVVHSLRQEGFTVGTSEEELAQPAEASLAARDRLRGYDLLVLLVAFRRGFVPVGQDLSIVQLEYESARELGLGILVFLLSEDEPWPRRFDEMDRDPAIRRWREQLRQNHTVQEFGYSPTTLHVGPAVAHWLAQREAQARKEAQQAAPSRPRRRIGEGGHAMPHDEPDLVSRFYRLSAALDAISHRLPHLWADLAAQADGHPPDGPRKDGALLQRFRRLGELMQRSRCRVGCLGFPQVGKSSTLTNLLDVPSQEGRAAVGGATARIAIRIAALPPGRQPTCKLAFLTPAEAEARRLALCRSLHLDPQQSPEELTAELQRRAEKTGSPNSDAHFFRRFLASCRALGSRYIQEPRYLESVDYARRHLFTHYPPGDEPSPSLLLREIEIGLPTAALPPEVELIDFPGLGLPAVQDPGEDLDGALVFLRADHLQARELAELLAGLRARFGDLAGRAWLVVTHCDILPATYDPGSLERLAGVLERERIPLHQVVLVANPYHEMARATADGKLSEQTLRSLGSEVKDGRPMPPETLAHLPALAEACRQCLTDGGIAALREAVGRQLPAAIKKGLCAEAAAEIRRLAAEVAERVEIARQRARMDVKEVANVLGWEAAVKALITALDRERSLVEFPGRSLQARLHDFFRQVQPDPGQDFDPGELAERHRTVSRVLAGRAVPMAREETLPAIYKNVGEALERSAREAGLEGVRLPSGLGPVEVLQTACRQYRAGTGPFLTVLESLRDEELFPLAPDEEGSGPFLTVAEYGQVIRHKIDAIVYASTHLMAHHVKEHLRQLARQLGLLGSDTQADAPAADEIDALVQAVREIGNDTDQG